MKIFLIGYMASGKTTIGKKLAKQLGIEFIDLDQYIESKEKMSITEIFSSGGEALFRGLEMKYLKQIIELKVGDYLLSTGGGTPCFYENMLVMNKSGITVYLEMDAKSITFRLMNAKDNRPIVSKVGEEELLEFVTQQMEERKYYYADAQLKVNALGFNKDKLNSLVEQLTDLN